MPCGNSSRLGLLPLLLQPASLLGPAGALRVALFIAAPVSPIV
jgi:hypothetical protein